MKMFALVNVEVKKLFRSPMSLAVMVLMPVALTLVFYFSMRDLPSWWLEGATHFEFLIPGAMGYAVIYMGMMVAMALCEYREAGLLKRLQTTPTSPFEYMGSLIIANMFIAIFQGLIVLLLAVSLGFEPQGGVLGVAITILFLGNLAITAVGLALITATLAKNPNAASGLSMIFLLPMMIFGTWLAAFNEPTYNASKFTPNFYVTESLTRIFHGATMTDEIIWKNFLILSIISLVVVVIGIQLFKRTEFR
ncbi:MAG TPA: ABC transporter permease [Anaerolineales bacterium]|nr:ABC transporter permease [Anaerolineales bacterium]